MAELHAVSSILKPEADVIEQIEAILALAREGKIRSFAAVAIEPDRKTARWWRAASTDDMFMLNGALLKAIELNNALIE